MSNYPCGMASARNTTIEFRCKKCNNSWEAEAVIDLGMCDLIDERDSQCPDCQSWESESL